MRTSLLYAALLSLALPAAAAAQSPPRGMRFEPMDTNRDGVITRDEWRGNDQSFRNHDWNGDGKLSGDEVRVGAQRQSRWDDRDIEGSVQNEEDWTPERFRALDHDGDGRLARSEWHASNELFLRVDRNHDNFLSRAEFTGADDTDREDRFSDLDTNHDGRVGRNEWHGSSAV